MSAWEEALRQLGLLATAFLAIILAFVGDMVRLFHEQERGGEKVTWNRIPASVFRSMLMGVVASATSLYLHERFGLPELVGGALGGILGYLGPSVIGLGFKVVMDRYVTQNGTPPKKPKRPKDDDE